MAYFLRTTKADGTSYGGFQWPREVGAVVEAPDWNAKPECGGGLHGLRDGLGDSWLLEWSPDALWWIVEADDADCIDIGGKWKFPRCTVVAVGQRHEVTTRLHEMRPGPINGLSITAGDGGTATSGHYGSATAGNGGKATSGHYGSATAGNGGTATSGHYGSATAGNGGTATVGDYGTATAGNGGTATVGYDGTAAAGDGGTLVFFRFLNGRRRGLVAYVGEAGIKPGVAYRANDDHTAVVEAA